MNKRVKAFTIMELTIAMLLAAITIAITYTCFTIIYKSYLFYKNKQQAVLEISQLNTVIERDFERGFLITRSGDDIVIQDNLNVITYTITPDFVLRKAGAVDTFKVKTTAFEAVFEGHPIQETSSDTEALRIDELNLEIILGTDKFPYYYFKHYSSQDLINRIPHAVN